MDRGKEVLCRYTKGKKLCRVADHDFTKSSITPSVHYVIDIPESIEGSFYRGQVHVGIKDNVFEPSSTWRHATELKSIFEINQRIVRPLLLLYTDGGPDHNITFIKTQLSLIALFYSWDLDFICAVRTPHHSWENPVERIMAILNIALNAAGIMRSETNSFEAKLSLKDLRKLNDLPGFKQEYLESLNDVKKLLQALFVQLKSRVKYFKVFGAASDEAIDNLQATISSIFDDELTIQTIKKTDLGKYPE